MKREIAALCLICGLLAGLFGCSSHATGPSEDVASTVQAQPGAIAAGLQLSVSKNSCTNNAAQDYFNVKNSGTVSLKLSDISVKYWIYDTTGSPVVPHVWYGGCATTANGTCTHQVSNVTATAIAFAGCGPDATHRGNWEITISTTDSTPLAPGMTWSGVQTAVNLASSANFSPGSSSWYSGCGNRQPYGPDVHFTVYLQGQSVLSNGVDTSCRRTPPFSTAPVYNASNPSVPPGATNVPGRVAGTSSVDGNGAFTYRVPIAVPPGRAGMEPHLALAYSSSGGNGLLGVGWNIEGTSSITRCRKFVAREGIADSIKVKLFHNDNAADLVNNFCLDGEKLVEIDANATSAEFRTERDKFARIVATFDVATASPSKFVVQRRDGIIATYLAGPAISGVSSRDATRGQPNGTPFSGVLAWPLSTEQDRFGNGVTYTYAAGDTGSTVQILSTISYTTCATGSACPYGRETRLVQFNYETRTDYISRWVAGLNAGMSVRLNSIDISTLDSGSPQLVRSYKLGYDASGATARSRLTTLSQCD